MEVELFISRITYCCLKAAGGIEKIEQVVLKCFEPYFPKGIDGNEYSQTTVSGSCDSLFKLKLEIVFDEQVNREIVHNNSFNPALALLKDLGQVLKEVIGDDVDSLTLLVAIEIKMVMNNQIYDHFYYKEKARFINGELKIT